ncbi:hypothetical protein BT96DRAFT_1014553 [Gymnopus androsaceus JB14]|uniref:T cell CD4 receptor C-terminal region domain-containing protein n=1 Tax=Gymnopus androsaceus JB14 TaxID=1447944 RepID=A0A6A4IA22_9AGAR|nr:hypothetical protein BT96DRAFT_1014553 [Gymnopus androsaceus JB14]
MTPYGPRQFWASVLWLAFEIHGVLSENVNITVDDSASNILYQPLEFWFTNSDGCANCLHPATSLAFNNTYHFGMHNTTVDADDLVAATSTANVAIPTVHRKPTGEDSDDMGKDNDSDDDIDTVDDDDRKKGRIRQRLDSDDPGFVDPLVTAQFNFTGSAVYLFCIEPLSIPSSPASPTTMNLSFTLDGIPSGTFFHEGSSSALGFTSNVPVLSLENLIQDPHVLLVNLGRNSVFAFDYMIYTTGLATTSLTPTSIPVPPTSTPSSAKNTDHRDVATFGGAVGGSVGVLGTLALCIFLSIWTRRRKSAKRERLARAREPEISPADIMPPMLGPAPFVPRYFPRTGPPPPPPYIAPSSTIRTQTSSLHTFTSHPVVHPSPPPLYRDERSHDSAASESPVSPIARLSPSLLPSPLGLDEVTVNVAGAQTELPPPPPFGQVVASSVIIPDADEITASREREIPEMAPPISSRPPSVHAHDNLTVPGPSSSFPARYR